jgi:hypothetical protein
MPMRQKAHRMLLCLIENRAAPVSKEALIRIVWEGAAISDDTLVNCVQEIRKALGDDARNPIFIRTMPKAGYWFIAPVEEDALAAEVVPVAPKRRLWPWVAAATAAISLFAGWNVLIPTQQPIPWGEAMWLKLDEGSGSGVRDSVRGSQGNIPSGVNWAPGIHGSALQFTGADVAVTGAGPKELTAGDGPRSIVTWIKTTADRADATTIFQYGHDNPDEPYAALLIAVTQTGRAALFSNRSSVAGASRVDDGEWHQVAAVFEGASRMGQIYVDGRQEGRAVLPDAHLAAGPAPRWSIGRAARTGTPFRGAIDDVRVFGRALSAAEILALHRCGSGADDTSAGEYFSPVFGKDVFTAPGEIRNTGADLAGAAVARRQSDCSLHSTRAADLGQDLTIEAEIRTGGNDSDKITEAGPFFRSRRSAPGDGIMGGTSAGFWVQLRSNGQVRVRRLNPSSTIAFSETRPGFDTQRFHKLSVTAKGELLTVDLNSEPVRFDQAGQTVREVRIQPRWEDSTPKGKNQGAAGIAFSAESNRRKAGGQHARNIRFIR